MSKTSKIAQILVHMLQGDLDARGSVKNYSNYTVLPFAKTKLLVTHFFVQMQVMQR